MPDPGLAEVTSLAAVQENIVAAPQDRTRKLATEVSRDIADGHFREGLKKHAEARNVDFTSLDRKINAFGTNIDENTGEITRTTDEANLITQIEQSRAQLETFLNKGYDGMTDPQKTALREIIILQAKRNPALAAQINQLGGNEQAFAERVIKDPHFSANLKNILSENLDGNFDNSVLDALDGWKAKRLTQNELEEEKNEAERRLNTVKARLKPFERDPATGLATTGATSATEIDRIQNTSGSYSSEIVQHKERVGGFEQKIEELRTELTQAQQRGGLRDLGTIDADIASSMASLGTAKGERDSATTQNEYRIASGKVAQAQAELSQLREEKRARSEITTTREPRSIQAEITRVTNQLMTERRDLASKLGDLEKIKQLQQTEHELEAERSSLEDKLREIVGRKMAADEQTNQAKRLYDSALELRRAMEKSFADKVSGSFDEAASKTINDYMVEISHQFEASLAKMKSEEQDQQTREALTAIQSRWQMPPDTVQRGPWWNRRTETTRPINKAALGKDLDTLLNRGDRQLVSDIMSGRINPATNAPYTQSEITSLLDNSAFMTKIGPEAIKQLLGQRLMNGGLRAEDINIISRSAWGQNMINKAIEQNGELRGQLTSVMGQDALNRHSFVERFSQVANSHPWLIYAILGIPVAAAMAIKMEATREQLNNQT